MGKGLPAAALCGVALAFAPAAEAAERYAAPDAFGGPPCGQSLPCPIRTAIDVAVAGDEVILAPGDYGSEADPISTRIDSPHAISVHGVDGQPRPRIITDADIGFQLSDPGASLRWVEIRYVKTTDPAIAGCAMSGTIDQIVVTTVNNAVPCALRPEGGTVRNSVFSGVGREALVAQGPWTLRGVTAVSQSFNGLAVAPPDDDPVTVTVVNSILKGAGHDVRAASNANAPLTVSLDHSNYEETDPVGTQTTITPAGSGTNQTAVPLFVGAARHDLRQAPGSPTLDAGLDASENGATDFEGEPRTLHGRIDIGADERPFAPDVATGAASNVGHDAATVAGTVTPWDFPASWQFEYGTTTAYGSHIGRAAPAPAASGQPVSAALTGLAPATTYHYRLSATGLGGTATGADATFTTAPAPPPPAPPRGVGRDDVGLAFVRQRVPRRPHLIRLGAQLRLGGAAPPGWEAAICGTLRGVARARRRSLAISSCATVDARRLRDGMRAARVFRCATLRALRSRRLVIRVRVVRPDGRVAFTEQRTSRRTARLCR